MSHRSVVVRPAAARDAEALARVLCRALRAAYGGTGEGPEAGARPRLAALEPGELVDGARTVIGAAGAGERTDVAEAGGAVVGFRRLRVHQPPEGPPPVGEITSLYVDPGAWGAGAGGRLLEQGLVELRGRGCRRAWLWVAAENERAQRFYRRHGFGPDGARQTYPMRAWGVDLGFALDVLRFARGLPTDEAEAPRGGSTRATTPAPRATTTAPRATTTAPRARTTAP